MHYKAHTQGYCDNWQSSRWYIRRQRFHSDHFLIGRLKHKRRRALGKSGHSPKATLERRHSSLRTLPLREERLHLSWRNCIYDIRIRIITGTLFAIGKILNETVKGICFSLLSLKGAPLEHPFPLDIRLHNPCKGVGGSLSVPINLVTTYLGCIYEIGFVVSLLTSSTSHIFSPLTRLWTQTTI
jgi:hypothetical protein